MNCQDQSGEWPQLTNTQKVVIGLGLITSLAVVTVATDGTGTVLACAAMCALLSKKLEQVVQNIYLKQ
ncbi:hypothetical protein [Pseudobutyrivibrio sp. OR37]|uniref:hypothetical protein n=1 Tax=Pseudobutyrivibrio sp. OR37 TaxID=1798186 RepID=UPI000B85144C|nr:hypothetical protein [Pseudobutyrivibrio sp. OR37]